MILTLKPTTSTRLSLLLAACLSAIGCGGEDPNAAQQTTPPAQATAVIETVSAKQAPVSFNNDIRPILSENCFFCHGPDPSHREADLRIDLFEAATADLGGYAALVPGDRDKSEIYLRITDTLDPMPPKKSHKTLTPEEIELIGRWIDEGGEYETHWAYAPPVRADPPTDLIDKDWPSNAIDRFILAKLEGREVRPSPQADKRTLMRRVTYDLTGLPPTPEQAAAFMNDPSPQAYENYVDQLLNSPAYGEHLAVWWLDLVRYADTNGLHGDQPRSSWPYRDWVIRSLNDNMPFDRFTVMQLAGDLMQDEPTQEMLIASGYNRLSPQTYEGGAQPDEYKAIYNADRVANFSDVWLGSSLSCAQCHDHKFDPFTAEDFYSMAAFFADINQTPVGHRGTYSQYAPPYTFVPQNDEQKSLIADHEAAYQQFIDAHPQAMYVEEYLTSTNPKPTLPGPDGKMPAYGEALKKLVEQRGQLAGKVPHVVTTRALPQPRTVRILNRGNWQDKTGKVVQPATPAFLGGPASSDDHRLSRLDLAKWTVSKDNPLTARALTNRLWGRYLGSAISSNTIELGSQGLPPTHPEMLDWLAIEFVEAGWDLKHLIRLIVTSETYKQSADAREDLALIDPNNTKLFARQSAVRLPAEAIRDQALAVSGLIKPRRGGPSVFPYQPDGHWEPLNFPRRQYPTSAGDDLYRRSLYTWVQRTFPHPVMTNFDAPARETCTGQRMTSNTPLQALTTLNGPVFVESARTLAQRLVQQDLADNETLDQLFKIVLQRQPRDSEREALISLLQRQREHFAKAPEDAKKLIRTGASAPPQDLDPVQVAAWTSLCRVVLNLHETMTRN